MRKENSISFNKKIVIKQLTKEDANTLISVGFPFWDEVLRQSLRNDFLQAAGLIPRTIRLVAYHAEEKRAIGFLCLVKNNHGLYSIKFVFIDPKFRKMGVGTWLINTALLIAKKMGAKKVHLDVDCMDSPVINFYKKLGFEVIGRTFVGQGYIAKVPRLRAIRRTLMGQGYIAKLLFRKKGQFIALQTMPKNKQLLYDIFQRCTNQKWIDFFEIDPNNLTNGYLQQRHPPFSSQVLINDSANSFALIFNTPFFSNASVELCSTFDLAIPSILEELVNILGNRDIGYTHFTLLNVNNDRYLCWFEEHGFETYQFFAMGITV